MKFSKVDLLISFKKLAAPFLDDMKDGVLLPSEHIAKKTGAQILLNIYCNDRMNFQDGSCCSSAEQYTSLQIITFFVLFIWYVLGKFKCYKINPILKKFRLQLIFAHSNVF